MGNYATPPKEAQKEALRNPGGWVHKVDGYYPPGVPVPPEAVIGSWKVNQEGKIVSLLMFNPGYRAQGSERKLSPEAHAEAMSFPGGALYDIDEMYDPDGNVPPEAIRGAWTIDAHGTLTGEFVPNPDYRPARWFPREAAVETARKLAKAHFQVEFKLANVETLLPRALGARVEVPFGNEQRRDLFLGSRRMWVLTFAPRQTEAGAEFVVAVDCGTGQVLVPAGYAASQGAPSVDRGQR